LPIHNEYRGNVQVGGGVKPIQEEGRNRSGGILTNEAGHDLMAGFLEDPLQGKGLGHVTSTLPLDDEDNP
jgi:hypothetical protein